LRESLRCWTDADRRICAEWSSLVEPVDSFEKVLASGTKVGDGGETKEERNDGLLVDAEVKITPSLLPLVLPFPVCILGRAGCKVLGLTSGVSLVKVFQLLGVLPNLAKMRLREASGRSGKEVWSGGNRSGEGDDGWCLYTSLSRCSLR
jgi:hypothetical protein